MQIPKPQELQSLNPRDYDIRVIVAGSRDYNDRKEFHEVMCAYIERFDNKPIIFISGDAPTGGDRLIILWCKKFGYPCLKKPAEWDSVDAPGAVVRYRKDGKPYNVRAGFTRNISMAEIGTHLVDFFDGKSSGSEHMIEEAMKRNLAVKIIRITIPTKE